MNLLLMANNYKNTYGAVFSQSSSEGRRLYGARVKNFTKATDLTAGTDDFKLVAPFNIYRAVVKYVEGKAQIVAREGDANFATYVANKDGDVFTMFPKYWYRRTQEANGDEVWQVSPFKIAGFLPSPLHYRNGVMHDWVGISSYQLGENGADAQSMPGLPLKINIPWTSFNTIQRAKGLYVANYAAACHMQILGSIKYNNLNWQTAIGSGISNTYSGEGTTAAEKAVISETNVNRIVVANATAAKFSIGSRATLTSLPFTQRLVTAITTYDASNMAIALDGAVFSTTASTTGIRRAVDGTGGADSVLGTDGMPTGTDSKTAVKTLGIENWYGNAWNILGGAFRYNDTDFYINTDVENISSWPATIDAALASGWTKLNGTLPTSAGYIQTMNRDASLPWATITKTVGGTSNAPVGDYFYRDATTDFRIVRLGGDLSNTTYAGPFYAFLYNTLSYVSWSCGAFGLFIPE